MYNKDKKRDFETQDSPLRQNQQRNQQQDQNQNQDSRKNFENQNFSSNQDQQFRNPKNFQNDQQNENFRKPQNDQDESTMENLLPDAGITMTVKKEFLFHPDIKSLDLSVETINGEVTITGDNINNQMRDLAISIARNVDGVRNVKFQQEQE